MRQVHNSDDRQYDLIREITLSKGFPKPPSSKAADVAITMGCGDACPIFPGKRYPDWELEDPAGLTVEQIRPIREEIDLRVRGMLAELLTREP